MFFLIYLLNYLFNNRQQRLIYFTKLTGWTFKIGTINDYRMDSVQREYYQIRNKKGGSIFIKSVIILE